MCTVSTSLNFTNFLIPFVKGFSPESSFCFSGIQNFGKEVCDSTQFLSHPQEFLTHTTIPNPGDVSAKGKAADQREGESKERGGEKEEQGSRRKKAEGKQRPQIAP